MKKTYAIEVDCANCANLMEEAARKTTNKSKPRRMAGGHKTLSLDSFIPGSNVCLECYCIY